MTQTIEFTLIGDEEDVRNAANKIKAYMKRFKEKLEIHVFEEDQEEVEEVE